MSNVNILLAQWKDKIPNDGYFLLQEKLKDADSNSLMVLSHLHLKSCFIGFVLGFFLGGFGIDRFYKGDIGLGIVKCLLFGIFYVIACFAMIVDVFGIIFLLPILLTIGMWCFIDLFLVWRGIKQDNLKKILIALG